MRDIEYAMWANEHAVISSFIVLVGGILGTIGYKEFKYWECAALAIALSLIVLLMEWPRSKRKKGNTTERRFQIVMTTVIDSLGIFGRNYFIRFIILLLFSIPCCLLVPTLIGGMCLIIAAFIYLVAAFNGEEWKPCLRRPEEMAVNPTPAGLPAPPSQPPPRFPGGSSSSAEGHDGPMAENQV